MADGSAKQSQCFADRQALNVVFARRAYALFVKLDFESCACSMLKLWQIAVAMAVTASMNCIKLCGAACQKPLHIKHAGASC